MIDKKISLGTIITIITIIATFIFTQGATSSKIESVIEDTNESRKSIQNNRNKVQDLEVGQERIETKIDEVMKRFDRLETLIMEM